jgi:hypothetical protein
MKEVTVHLEEHLVKTFKVEVNTDDSDEAMDIAEQAVLREYDDGNIVLTADDYNNTTLIHAEIDGFDTEWRETYRAKDDSYTKEQLKEMCKIREDK